MSFFCREYWRTSAGAAVNALTDYPGSERLKKQVQQTCVLELLVCAVCCTLCPAGADQPPEKNLSQQARTRLRNAIYYVHENALVMQDLVQANWNQTRNSIINIHGEASVFNIEHQPENLDMDILVRSKRKRNLRKGEHGTALRMANDHIISNLKVLCRSVDNIGNKKLSFAGEGTVALGQQPSVRNSVVKG